LPCRPRSGLVPDPNNDVKKAEDKTLSSGQLSLERLNIKDLTPLRPGYGTGGQQIKLWANYVEMHPPPTLVLHRYDIKVSEKDPKPRKAKTTESKEPTVPGRKLVQVIRLLLDSPELAAFKRNIVTDFKSTCVSKDRFPKDDQIINIVYRAEGEDEPRLGATTYCVRLLYTKTVRAGELVDYLCSTDLAASCENKAELIQAFNIFMNHYAKSANDKLTTMGSSRTFPLNPQSSQLINLWGGLNGIRGFFASVRPATSRILVNVNVSHAAFFQPGPLGGLMEAYGLASLPRLEKFLKGVRVRTNHLPEKRNKAGEIVPRIKTILGLATREDGKTLPEGQRPRVAKYGGGPKEVEFWLNSPTPSPARPSVSGMEPASPSQAKKRGGKGGKRGGGPAPAASSGGRYISVYDFFMQSKSFGFCCCCCCCMLANTSIEDYADKCSNLDPRKPVVNVGTKDKPTYLPAEVCIVQPGQPAGSLLSPQQTQQMIKLAVRKPGANASDIATLGMEIVGLTDNNTFLVPSYPVDGSAKQTITC